MDMYYFKEPNSSLLAKAIKVGSKGEEDVMPFVEELGKVIFISPDLTKKQKKEIWTDFVNDAYDNFSSMKQLAKLPQETQTKISDSIDKSIETIYSRAKKEFLK